MGKLLCTFLIAGALWGQSGSGVPLCAGAPQTAGGCVVHAIGSTWDGAGSALTTGNVHYITVPYACTIQAWNITADTGTITITTWKVATGTAIPTVSNSISTSGVSLASGTAIHSPTLTDFITTTVSANDIFGFNISAVASATKVSFVLQCQ